MPADQSDTSAIGARRMPPGPGATRPFSAAMLAALLGPVPQLIGAGR